MPDDLSLVGTEELLDELCRRFDTLVFAACRDHAETEDGHVTELREYRQDGCRLAAVGLAHWVAHIVLRDMIDHAKEFDE